MSVDSAQISITSTTNGTALGCNWDRTNSKLTATSGGTCILTITKFGNTNYLDATTNVTFVFKKQQSPISITNGSVLPVSNEPVTLTKSGGSGTGAVSFTLNSGSKCSLNSNKLSISSPGSCTVVVTQAADAEYDAISNSKTFTISAGTLTFTAGTESSVVNFNLSISKMVYLQSNPIITNMDQAGRVTFSANGLQIPGCTSIKAVGGVAICQYKPTQLGIIQITVTITPDDSNYKSATKSANVSVSPK